MATVARLAGDRGGNGNVPNASSEAMDEARDKNVKTTVFRVAEFVPPPPQGLPAALKQGSLGGAGDSAASTSTPSLHSMRSLRSFQEFQSAAASTESLLSLGSTRSAHSAPGMVLHASHTSSSVSCRGSLAEDAEPAAVTWRSLATSQASAPSSSAGYRCPLIEDDADSSSDVLDVTPPSLSIPRSLSLRLWSPEQNALLDSVAQKLQQHKANVTGSKLPSSPQQKLGSPSPADGSRHSSSGATWPCEESLHLTTADPTLLSLSLTPDTLQSVEGRSRSLGKDQHESPPRQLCRRLWSQCSPRQQSLVMERLCDEAQAAAMLKEDNCRLMRAVEVAEEREAEFVAEIKKIRSDVILMRTEKTAEERETRMSLAEEEAVSQVRELKAEVSEFHQVKMERDRAHDRCHALVQICDALESKQQGTSLELTKLRWRTMATHLAFFSEPHQRHSPQEDAETGVTISKLQVAAASAASEAAEAREVLGEVEALEEAEAAQAAGFASELLAQCSALRRFTLAEVEVKAAKSQLEMELEEEVSQCAALRLNPQTESQARLISEQGAMLSDLRMDLAREMEEVEELRAACHGTESYSREEIASLDGRQRSFRAEADELTDEVAELKHLQVFEHTHLRQCRVKEAKMEEMLRLLSVELNDERAQLDELRATVSCTERQASMLTAQLNAEETEFQEQRAVVCRTERQASRLSAELYAEESTQAAKNQLAMELEEEVSQCAALRLNSQTESQARFISKQGVMLSDLRTELATEVQEVEELQAACRGTESYAREEIASLTGRQRSFRAKTDELTDEVAELKELQVSEHTTLRQCRVREATMDEMLGLLSLELNDEGAQLKEQHAVISCTEQQASMLTAELNAEGVELQEQRAVVCRTERQASMLTAELVTEGVELKEQRALVARTERQASVLTAELNAEVAELKEQRAVVCRTEQQASRLTAELNAKESTEAPVIDSRIDFWERGVKKSRVPSGLEKSKPELKPGPSKSAKSQLEMELEEEGSQCPALRLNSQTESQARLISEQGVMLSDLRMELTREAQEVEELQAACRGTESYSREEIASLDGRRRSFRAEADELTDEVAKLKELQSRLATELEEEVCQCAALRLNSQTENQACLISEQGETLSDLRMDLAREVQEVEELQAACRGTESYSQEEIASLDGRQRSFRAEADELTDEVAELKGLQVSEQATLRQCRVQEAKIEEMLRLLSIELNDERAQLNEQRAVISCTERQASMLTAELNAEGVEFQEQCAVVCRTEQQASTLSAELNTEEAQLKEQRAMFAVLLQDRSPPDSMETLRSQAVVHPQQLATSGKENRTFDPRREKTKTSKGHRFFARLCHGPMPIGSPERGTKLDYTD